MFWALTMGILLGAGQLFLTAVTVVGIAILLTVLVQIQSGKLNSYLLVVRMADGSEKAVAQAVNGLKFSRLKSKTISAAGVEATYEIRVEKHDAFLNKVNAIPGEFLIRFMTSHPKDAGPRLFDAMATCEKVAPVLHLPFQSGSSRVLKAMNRGYTREHYLELIAQLRQRIPNIVLTSDVIVGFPGETQEEFEETLSLIEAVRYDALFTFIFSPRRGTPAAKLPDPMPKEQKSANFQRLLRRQNEISGEKHQAYIGKTYRCLVDGEGEDGLLTARTDGGRLIHLKADPSCIGTWQQAKITGASTWALFGELA